MIKAVYPGTFDPITNGHVDIAMRASRLFDQVLVAVANNTSKSTMFTLHERIELAKASLAGLKNIEIISFNSLITELAREQDAKVIIRGLRAVSDFDYEFQMAGMNRQLLSDIETGYLTPTAKLSYISSTLVREIHSYNDDVSEFVHPSVAELLKEKFSD